MTTTIAVRGRLLIYLVVYSASIFFTSFSWSATVGVGKGSYSNTFPSSVPSNQQPPSVKYVTENISGPVPTTSWFSTLVSNAQSHTHYAYPLSFYAINETTYSGLQIGCPNVGGSSDAVIASFIRDIEVRGTVSGRDLKADTINVDAFSDWTVSPLWKDNTDSSAFFKATYGHGLVFVYFEFSGNCNPKLTFLNELERVFDEQGEIGTGTFSTDHLGIKVNDKYYGLFVPTGSTFTVSSREIAITLPSDKRFFSIGLLTTQNDLAYYYQRAYAFVTDTTVSWNYNESTNDVTTTFTLTTDSKQGSQSTPLVALLPHQWKYMSDSFLSFTYQTLLGTMKTLSAQSFTVTQKFHGVLPFLPDKGTYDRAHLQELLTKDKTTGIAKRDTYFNGKEMAKVANLIPIAEQLGDTEVKEYLKSQLKTTLIDWFTYNGSETSRFFVYDNTWKGFIGYNNLFYGYNYTDHHFHNGYMIYAAALLSMYDSSFKTDYGEFVEYLIRDCSNWRRDDPVFPFLRTFDPYMGHSYCAGTINIGNNGNNQESSSEAMNAWAAIILWGMVTDNSTIRDLGIWGYTTEYSGIHNYYFDIDDDVFPSAYGHKTVGILFDDKVEYTTWWTGQDEAIHGIQMIPQTGSMLYLGYYPEYCQQNYNDFLTCNGGVEDYDYWYDILWKYQCFYNPSLSLNKLNEYVKIDFDGDSFTFLYHWMHNFNALGNVDIATYADIPSYAVFKKDTTYTYAAYNSGSTVKKVSFYRGGYLGSFYVRPKTLGVASVFPPEVTKVSASSYLNEGKSTVQIEGGPFLSGVQTVLRKTGKTDITAENIAVSNGNSLQCVFDLTGIAPGNWELLVINPGGSLETAQPTVFGVSGKAPVITTFSPANVSNTKKVSVTFVGQNFYQGVAVMLKQVNEQDISGEDVSLLSQERLTCTFDVRDKKAGFWDVVLTNEDDQVTTLVDAFEITETGALYVYPNPCRLLETPRIYFVNVPENAALSIYTLAGELVYADRDITANPYVWEIKNSFENKVSSGIYMYVIRTSDSLWKGKIAIIK